MIQVKAVGKTKTGSPLDYNVEIDARPNECPVCGVTINPDSAGAWLADENLDLSFRCTNLSCRRSFVGLYTKSAVRKTHNVDYFTLDRCIPALHSKTDFPDDVKEISSSFVLIYGQALQAEKLGLLEIAGPGYRKSLEFLVKDYAILLHPEAADEIRNVQLVPVIKNYLSGNELTVVSVRAAWLGNDETHYERRWAGKDLPDLKKLIDATVHFIAMQRLVEGLPIDMPDPKSVPAVQVKP